VQPRIRTGHGGAGGRRGKGAALPAKVWGEPVRISSRPGANPGHSGGDPAGLHLAVSCWALGGGFGWEENAGRRGIKDRERAGGRARGPRSRGGVEGIEGLCGLLVAAVPGQVGGRCGCPPQAGEADGVVQAGAPRHARRQEGGFPRSGPRSPSAASRGARESGRLSSRCCVGDRGCSVTLSDMDGPSSGFGTTSN